jgi:hypothetical protein
VSEPLFLSLYTFGLLLDTTTANQGDHCIIALAGDPARPPVDSGNLTVLNSPTACGNLAASLATSIPALAALFTGVMLT